MLAEIECGRAATSALPLSRREQTGKVVLFRPDWATQHNAKAAKDKWQNSSIIYVCFVACSACHCSTLNAQTGSQRSRQAGRQASKQANKQTNESSSRVGTIEIDTWAIHHGVKKSRRDRDCASRLLGLDRPLAG